MYTEYIEPKRKEHILLIPVVVVVVVVLLLVNAQLLWMKQPGVNSIKKYKCTLQVGPLFLQIHTNLNPLRVFTSSH